MRPTAGLLLTGGASRRLGVDKARLVRGGVRLADHVAAIVRGVADPVLEVGSGASELRVVREDPAGAGPLVALAAGFAALDALDPAGMDAGVVLVVAVDQPALTAEVLTFLRDRPESGATVPVVAGRAQPLCARYPRSAGVAARELVAGGARAVHDLLARIPVTYLDETAWGGVAAAAAFADLDEPADLLGSGWEAGPGSLGTRR